MSRQSGGSMPNATTRDKHRLSTGWLSALKASLMPKMASGGACSMKQPRSQRAHAKMQERLRPLMFRRLQHQRLTSFSAYCYRAVARSTDISIEQWPNARQGLSCPSLLDSRPTLNRAAGFITHLRHIPED
jgi:hypothetical protein